MEKLLTTEQVAERHSVKISTVWDWIRAGKLPAIKIGGGPEGGGRYRIRPEDLADFEKLLGTKEGANGTH